MTLFFFLDRLVDPLPLLIGALPLGSALVIGLGGKWRLFRGVGTGLLALAMLLSWCLLAFTYYGLTWQQSFTWLALPGSEFRLGIWIDFRVAVMVALTTTISLLVHGYAMVYLQTAHRRYGVLTGSFVSAMLGFWMADNLLGRFMGWELIGWGSYLLIGFWHQKSDAARSSTKAWLTNQLGSVSLLIGILLLRSELGTWNLAELAALPPSALEHRTWLGVARFCLVAGLGAKSAQWPWFSWLSSAMTAPTPASALIHSATLVGAGVYWLVDLAPVLGGTMLTGVACWGAMTAFMGAYAALTQQHAKQVLAYSTISQLGYAVMAVGVGASGVGLLHLVTHAFAKACLFLCIGIVSQWVGTGNMQAMGGLRKKFPVVFGLYLLAACSLLGVPGLAGALSKEAILDCTWAWAHEQALAGHYWAYAVAGLAWVASMLAVVYLGRQAYLVFMGTPRWSSASFSQAAYRAAWVIQGSLVLLALGTLSCWHGSFIGSSNWLLYRLGTVSLPLSHGVLLASWWALGLGGLLWVAWHFKRLPSWPAPWARLSLQGWYLDELAWAIAKAVLNLSSLVTALEHRVVHGLVQAVSKGYILIAQVVHWIDRQVIAGFLQAIGKGYVVLAHGMAWLDRELISRWVLGVASVPRYLGRWHERTQQGSWQLALLWMFLGMGLLLGLIYFLG